MCGLFAHCKILYRYQCFPQIDARICMESGKPLPASWRRKRILQQRYHVGCRIWRRIGQPCSCAKACKRPLKYTVPPGHCEISVAGGPFLKCLPECGCDKISTVGGTSLYYVQPDREGRHQGYGRVPEKGRACAGGRR